ncbi:MAG: hypothetical protein Q8T09_11485 [Candidatus Melainabacteria bacterium]|nr:hypothetical protein [Candidatus Melainabacteria bacterium]
MTGLGNSDHLQTMINLMTASFYNCSCGWKGDQLIYNGFDYHPHLNVLPSGQGVCPNCYRKFAGCIHPDTLYQPLADLVKQ